jgi:hypothetical protein
VQSLGAIATAAQCFGQLVDFGARSAEDDDRRRRFHVEHARERGDFVSALHDVGDLANTRRLAVGQMLARNRDAHGLAQMPAGDRTDRVRHGRREKRGLPVARHGGENRLEVVGETHVEHLVRFVENEHLDRVERERPTTDVIQRTTWCRHDDIDAALEGTQLLRHRLSTVDRQNPHAEWSPVLMDGLGDLHRELARRNENESAYRLSAVVRRSDALEQRQGERSGLPRSGRGLPEHVASSEERRNRFALDIRGLFVAECGQRACERGRETELEERAVVKRARRRRCQFRCHFSLHGRKKGAANRRATRSVS